MREPDQQTTWENGSTWRAWRVSKVPEGSTTLALWLVDCPGAHACWTQWIISVVHLREMPGLALATKAYPEAEYEFLIGALDPTKPADPDVHRFPIMNPIDVVHQFHGVTDADAARLPELAVKYIMTGKISPDQDFRSAWEEILAKTVEHYRTGHGLS